MNTGFKSSAIPPLFSDLITLLQGDIDCSFDTLNKYSTDNSQLTQLPQAVIFPKNSTDIKHIISFAREFKIPITACGKRSSQTGGTLTSGVIVDLTRYFNQIRNINMLDHTIEVDAGVTLKELLSKLHAWQFDIPLLLNQEEDSTLGGIIATRSVQPGSFRNGSIREWIESLTVVLDNGEEHIISDGITPSGRLLGIYQKVFPIITKSAPIIRASKPKLSDDSTGYNIWNTSIGPRQLLDQLTGSEGTLGIITSIKLRVTPFKPFLVTACIPVASLQDLPAIIESAKHSDAQYISLYDAQYMELAHRYRPKLIPQFEGAIYFLLVSHSASTHEKALSMHAKYIHTLQLDKESYDMFESRTRLDEITSRGTLFSLFEQYTNNALTPITSCNGLMINQKLILQCIKDVEEYLGNLGNMFTISGNIASGHISITTLFDTHTKDSELEILSYNKTIFELIKNYNGGISGTDGEGLLRAPFLSYVYNEATLALFKEIKDAWDPLHTFNPGKKISSHTNYILQRKK
jgi:FAD/FMN-containing dehydrogenase